MLDVPVFSTNPQLSYWSGFEAKRQVFDHLPGIIFLPFVRNLAFNFFEYRIRVRSPSLPHFRTNLNVLRTHTIIISDLNIPSTGGASNRNYSSWTTAECHCSGCSCPHGASSQEISNHGTDMILLIESVKTRSMQNGSTEVLCKNEALFETWK